MNIAYPWEAQASISLAQDVINLGFLIVFIVLFYNSYLKRDNLFDESIPFEDLSVLEKKKLLD